MSSSEWRVEELTDAEQAELEAAKATLDTCGVPFAGPEGDEDVNEDWDPNAPTEEEDGE